jgi:PTH1 family peptidyl-tRNA hydrolase
LQLIIGLGNPGAKYAATRHNVGFWFVDRIAAEHGRVFKAEPRFQGDLCSVDLGHGKTWLLKPTTYVNRSGVSAAACARYYRISMEQILVVHDDLDLEPGTVRLKRGGGHGGHNGLRDIVSHLGAGFLRLRLGVGRAPSRDDGAGYVLSRPTRVQQVAIDGAIDAALDQLPVLVGGDLDRVMNVLNRKATG